MTDFSALPGRDRRAVVLAPPLGPSSDVGRHHVVVLGGGVAGLAAATGLAERGVRVTLVEREDQLGGRVRAWPLGDGRTMSRGFHAFFRQYYNLRALLRRTDPELQRLTSIDDYPLVAADGHRDSFANIPRTPPLNLAAFVLHSKSFPLRDLVKVDGRSALELLRVEFPASFSDYDGESAADFLDRLRFPPAARHLALEVFARSFFADPREFSAGELVAMFHTYFVGSAEGLLFDVPDDDYDTALWAPLGRYLQDLGVDIRTGTSAGVVESGDDGVEVDTTSGVLTADAAVLATDLTTTQGLLAPERAVRADREWRSRLARLRTAPRFAVWRIWFDVPAAADRPPFLGTSGYGVVDNISVVDRFERGAAEWARTSGGSVVELHAYALPDGLSEGDVRGRMRRVLDWLYPEYGAATVVAEEYLERADCPLIGTEPWADRPAVTTPDPRVVLAGDGVRCELPVALMERAATTGFQAANALLRGWGLGGHALWSPPLRGRLPRSRRSRSQSSRAQRTSPARTA